MDGIARQFKIAVCKGNSPGYNHMGFTWTKWLKYHQHFKLMEFS